MPRVPVPGPAQFSTSDKARQRVFARRLEHPVAPVVAGERVGLHQAFVHQQREDGPRHRHPPCAPGTRAPLDPPSCGTAERLTRDFVPPIYHRSHVHRLRIAVASRLMLPASSERAEASRKACPRAP